MFDVIETQIDERVVKIYKAAGENLPVIYANDYEESGREVLAECEALGCLPFHLVTISKIGWDAYLSPWVSEPVVAKNDNFKGLASEYLGWLLSKVVPYAEKTLAVKNPKSYIAGYSMAGLFALWSLYQTDFFAGAVAASGSLWFPRFREYALENTFPQTPEKIYLSLGDRESAGKNPVLQRTETIFRELAAHYAEQNISVTFELNKGNHFKDINQRVAKGYKWLLEN